MILKRFVVNLFRISLILILLFVNSCNNSSDVDPVLLLIDVEKELDHTICENEGVRLGLGGDINNNGILENNEVSSYTTFCNDENGDLIFITWYPLEDAPTCEGFNGYKIDIGYDFNDSLLKEKYISFYICSNIDVKNYIVNSTEIVLGGLCGKEYKVEMGDDQNQNGVLDVDEIEYSNVFYNRQALEDNTIDLTLSDSDYEAIADAYSDSNPEGAENLRLHKSFFEGSLWSTEEMQEAVQSRLMEIGSKMDCQKYLVTFESFPAGTLKIAFRYSENLGVFVIWYP